MPVARRKEPTIKPYWTSECGRAVVYVGDCREVMAAMEAEQFHAVVTDPPYGLEFMGKEWDAPWKGSGSVNAREHRAAEMGDPVKSKYLRHQTTYGLSDPQGYQAWFLGCAEAMIRVAKPGAHLLSFGGTRMWHRMACAVEDAGWEIRDTIMWVYAGGFPKSHDVSKAIDKILGATRTEVLGAGQAALAQGQFNSAQGVAGGYGYKDKYNVMAPATDAARQWSGWGSALKPAYEPVILARKPMESTIAQCVLDHGTGGLNIDGCRVGTDQMPVTASDGTTVSQNTSMAAPNTGRIDLGTKTGRWPANFIHDGSDEVVELFPSEAGGGGKDRARIPAARSGAALNLNTEGSTFANGVGHGDSGSAARFFYTAKADSTDRPHGKLNYLDGYDTIEIEYTTNEEGSCHQSVEKVQLRADMGTSPPKVTGVSGCTSEVEGLSGSWSTFLFGNGSMAQFLKDTNSTIKITTSSTTESRTLNWLTTSLTNASIPVANSETESGGNPAASAKRCNQSQLVIILGRSVSLPGAKSAASGTQLRISASVARPVVHPTCKPLDLMRYLVRLVCAPGGKVLDPFMGSGSTGCAAILEGIAFVGIEQSEEYADIAIGRIKLALQQRSVDSTPPPPGETARPVHTNQETPPPPKRLRG